MNLIGQKVDNYQVERIIGQGGGGAVYLALDVSTGRKVALKLLPLDKVRDGETRVRFERGGTQIDHHNIVKVYKRGHAANYLYIAMQHISGGSLEDLLRQRGPLAPAVACQIVSQIAEALDFAHQRGVVHRDVKPSNILLSSNRQTAYLADFGVAQLAGHETVTQFGSIVGTPEYMSPEQIRGGKVDGRSDIYSLGITLYQMLTGALPFAGEPASVVYHQVHSQARPISQVRSDLPAGVERVLNRAIAKDPNKRYQMATHFARALHQAVYGRAPINRPALALALAAVAVIVLFLYMQGPVISSGGTPTVITEQDGTTTPEEEEEAQPPTSTVGVVDMTIISAAVTSDVSTVAPTRTRTPTPAVTVVTATPTAGALQLVAPAANVYVRQQGAEQTFQWQWSGTLPSNQHFEIRFYEAGTDVYEVPAGWIKERQQVVNLNNLSSGGQFEWTVVIVQGRDGRWERDIVESERRPIRWEGR